MRVIPRVRFWLAIIVGVLSSSLAVFTAVSHSWIEAVLGVDPDRHSGAIEWLIVVSAAAAAVACIGVTRAEWRRATQASVGAS